MVWDPKAPLNIPTPAQHVLGGRQERLGNIARRPRIQSTNTHTHTEANTKVTYVGPRSQVGKSSNEYLNEYGGLWGHLYNHLI